MSGVTIEAVERASLLEYNCAKCKDWGTIMVKVGDKDKMELCPAACEAARKFELLRANAQDGPEFPESEDL